MSPRQGIERVALAHAVGFEVERDAVRAGQILSDPVQVGAGGAEDR